MPDQNSSRDPRLEYAALTDVGMRRSNNQDSHVVVPAADAQVWRERGHFFMVADGMGAHAAGELASKLTVDGVAHLYQKYTELSPPESLEKALLETNSEVHRRGQANSDFRNMGTTASVLVVLPQGALVAHIGDSRIYRLRGDVLHQLTFDHSLVWELRKAGQLSDDKEVAHSIPKNVITRSVGPNANVQVDIEGPFPVQPGDVFLLCSDGLTGKLEDRELAAILSNLSPEEAVHLLVDLANLRGGPDNITVIVSKAGADIATSEVEEEPLRIRQGQSSTTIRPLVWVAVSVFLLIALILSMTNRVTPALIVAALGGICLLVEFVARKQAETGGVSLTGGRRLGAGPHAEAKCPTTAETVNLLRALTANVRQRDSGSFPIDWSEFDQLVHRAAAHEREGRPQPAISDYARAIRALMVEVREAEHQQANDSAIDL